MTTLLQPPLKALVVPENTIELSFDGEELMFDEYILKGGLKIVDGRLINRVRIHPSYVNTPRPIEKVKLFRAKAGTPYHHIRRAMRLQGYPAMGAWDMLRLLVQEKELSDIYALDPYSKNHEAWLILAVQSSGGKRHLKTFAGNDVGHGAQKACGTELFAGIKE